MYEENIFFDTKKLKKETFEQLASHGIDKKIIEKTYKECRENYCFSRHTQIIKNKHGLQVSNLMHDWLLTLNFESYLFPGTIDNLKKLSKKHNLILLTKGEFEFQNIKIKGSKISKHFKEIHITLENKELFLKNKKFAPPIYFINDKKSENKIIKKKFPKMIIKEKMGETIE